MKGMTLRSLKFALFAALALVAAACQPTETNTNTNTNTANLNINSNSNLNSNQNSDAATSTSGIDTQEPDKYQATVTLKFETTGETKSALPPLKAEVARNGADRRMEFVLPGGEKVVYLTKDGKQYLVSPSRKQFAELNQESLGFEVRNLMMPEQIVNQVKSLSGVEKVGEEQVNGRTVVKYRYGATTDTQTKAGDVSTESEILVDKETGLPVRSVTSATSDSSSVQGVKGMMIVTEISNISENVDQALFDKPADFKEVQPEEIRAQVNSLFSAAVAIVGQLMKAAQPSSSPAANSK